MMKALYIESNESILLKEIPIPQLIDGQVLIKVEYASIHPFDKELLNGFKVGKKDLIGIVPGFEGSGTVIASGGGILGWKLKGNRVAFFTENQFGSFGQYAIADSQNCVELPNDVSFETASCSIINPLSALMMFQLLDGSQGIITTGATSNLSRMIMRYFQFKGIHVLNIVKSESEEKALRDEGAKLILNINQEDFTEKLRLISSSYGAQILFDSVGGELLSKILNEMPFGSKAYVYANYSKQQLNGILSANLMYQNKKIFGFNFLENLTQKNVVQLKLLQKEAINNVNSLFKTLPTKIFDLSEFEQAIESKERVILRI